MVQKINWYQKFINIVKKIVWPLSIVVKFFKWHFNNLPLSEYFIDGWFPVISTIGLTSLFELALHKIFPNNHHVVYYGAILFAIFVLFIVLFFQHKLRENCFGESLKEFIASSKGMHPVTKKFGSYILEDFITGTFIKSEIYKEIYAKQNGIYNLSDLLKRIELKDGFQLPGELYAVLLSQSVDLEPDCLLSTWDFSIIKIEEVFNEKNEFKKEYELYFNALGKIYSNIAKKDKVRIFIFENQNEYSEKYVKDERWKKIVEKHRAWDFDKIFYCTREVFDRYKSSNIYMEDFVYFEFKHLKKFWINKCVIGMNAETKISHLDHSKRCTGDTKEFFESLKGRSTEISIDKGEILKWDN